MATANANAETVYKTPDSWGNESEYAERNTMLKIIESLKDLGDDWKDISISDCEEYTLGVDENSAAYISRTGDAVKLKVAYSNPAGKVYTQK